MGKEVPRDRKVRLEDWWRQLPIGKVLLFVFHSLITGNICTYRNDQAKNEIHMSVENICIILPLIKLTGR